MNWEPQKKKQRHQVSDMSSRQTLEKEIPILVVNELGASKSSNNVTLDHNEQEVDSPLQQNEEY